MRAVVYVRVSTEGQEREGTSLKTQEDACLKLAVQNGYDVLPEYIFQEVYTGSELDRPKLNALRELIRSEAVNAVVCYSTDRLARKPVYIAIIAEECEKHGVALMFVTEPLDNSPEGQFIRYAKGFAAQIEHEKIRERTVRGKKERARSGKMPQGTGKGTFGYQYNKGSGRRTVVEAEAEVVRYIFKLALERNSFHRISTILNGNKIPTFSGGKWHPLTVKRMLTNPAYMGITYYGMTKRISLGGNKRRLEQRPRSEWIEVPDVTPSIISKEQFQAVQEVIVSRDRKATYGLHKYLLTGHVYCGYCGSPMCGSTLSGRYRYYYCRGTRPGYAIPKECDAKYMRADAVEEAIWQEVADIIKSPNIALAEIRRKQDGIANPSDSDLKRIDREIQSCRNYELRMVQLYGVGEIDVEHIRTETQRIKTKRQTLEEERDRLLKQRATISNFEIDEDKVRVFCHSLERRVQNLDDNKKRLALEALDIKALVRPGNLELHGAVPSYVTIGRTSA